MTRRAAIAIVTLGIGIALLAWQIQKVGLAAIGDGLVNVTALGFATILVLALLRFTLRALAWTTMIAGRVPLADAVAATVAGDAMSNMTPLSVIVGEPAKAMYLRRSPATSHALAALAAENVFYGVSVALFIILGTIAMLIAFSVPDAVRWAGLLSLSAMVVVLAGVLWTIWREPAVVSSALARVPWLQLDALVARVRAFETRTYGFVRQRPGQLVLVGLCEVSFHLLSFVECYFTLWLLMGQSLPLEAFVLDTFSRIVTVVFKMVPLRLGVDEAGSATVAVAIGLPQEVGLTLALVRKGRMLVWAAIGFALLARRGLSKDS